MGHLSTSCFLNRMLFAHAVGNVSDKMVMNQRPLFAHTVGNISDKMLLNQRPENRKRWNGATLWNMIYSSQVVL